MRKNNIDISIIVPVYNTSKYLEKCLISIKDAIYDNCEVIIVNDGSTDDSENSIYILMLGILCFISLIHVSVILLRFVFGNFSIHL